MVGATMVRRGPARPEGYLVEKLGYGHAMAGMEPRHAKCPAYMRGYKKGLTEQKKPVKL